MKATIVLRPGRHASRGLSLELLVLLGVVLLGSLSAHANVATWSGTSSTTWTDTGNWSGGSASGAPANSLTTDTAYFDSSSYTHQPNAGTTSIGGIEVGGSSGTLTIAGTTLSIGNSATVGTQSGGILIDSGSGSVTISAKVALGGSQSFTNNASNGGNGLTLSGGITSVAGTPSTLTLGGSSSGGITITGAVTDGTSAVTTLIVNASGTGQVDFNAASNTFSGGLTVARGTALVNSAVGTSLGSGTIILGDSSGSNNASLLLNNGETLDSPIVLGASTGTLTIGNNSTTSTFGGAISLNNNNLFISGKTATSGSLTVSGGISGTGSVTIKSAGGLPITISTTSINNAGTITNSGTLTATTIGAVIGANVTGLTENSSTSALVLTNANTFTGTTTVSSGTLVLQNNLALQDSTLSTASTTRVTVTGYTTPTIGGLTGGTALATAISTGYSSVTSLTLNPATGVSDSYSGVIADGATGMTLSVSGAGTQTLSGSNTYSGGTSVSAGGTLFVANANPGTTSATGSGALSVVQGATFGGTGSSSTTASSTAFNVGASGSGTATVYVGQVSAADTNTTGTLTLTATAASTIENANLVLNLASTSTSNTTGNSNLLNLGGTALAGATFTNTTLTLNPQGGIAVNTAYVLIEDTSGFSGTDLSTTNVNGVNVITGGGLTITGSSFGSSTGGYSNGSYNGSYLFESANGQEIEVEVVPEPGTWALMLGGLVVLSFWQRRKYSGN